MTRPDFKALSPSIEKEDLKYTFKRSGALLAANPNDTSEMHAMMVYIRLFSVAGLVSKHKLSYKKLEEVVRLLIGQHVLMAAHPYLKGEGGGLNATYFEKTQLCGLFLRQQ